MGGHGARRWVEMLEAERFGRCLEALRGGRRPLPGDVAGATEAGMVRLALLLLSSSATPPDPDNAFVTQLRRRVADADEGSAALRRGPRASRADLGSRAERR